MRINKKKFIYLISPNRIYPEFYQDLNQVLRTDKVALFQLRLKKYSIKQKIVIGKKIQRICEKNNIKFLVNDDPILSKILNADGCHLGQKDMTIKNARKIIRNKIIGVTCHNSIELAKAAIKESADYIAFGAFFSTTTKKVKFKADIKILNKIKKLTKTPIVAIGGINFDNYKKLLLNNANLLAISSYVWNNKKYKPFEAIKKLK
ncbi:thiamine phosphate synthase [Candidatus Pelagibacter bacterium]|nr:thiamine phosphate synthase [Candidatus Pelagibacter bacterium]